MREELQQFKRAKIIEVASRLFYERGFVGTTLDAIAAELSVTKPFVYQYFAGKHDILAAVVEQEIRRVIDLFDGIVTVDPQPARCLRRFVQAWVAENIEFRRIFTVFWQEQHHIPDHVREASREWQKRLNERLTKLIRAGDEAGVFASGNPRLAAFAVIGALQWVPRWYREDGDLGVAEVGEYFGALALRMVGFRADPSVGATAAQ